MPRRSRRRPQPAAGPQFRRNNRIRVPEVRLIDEEGNQLGVVSTDDARAKAREAGLDLVEVAPEARPPVCKILDYGRFKYEAQKKEKRNKSGASASNLKELRVRPAISPHDLSYRLADGRKFLLAGHKVLVVCIFRGRQMAHPEHGHEVMRRVAEDLADIAKIETPAKLMGRRMSMLLAPTAAAKQVAAKLAAEKAKAAEADAKSAEAPKAASPAPQAEATDSEAGATDGPASDGEA